MPPRLSSIARGFEQGLAGFLERQARERAEERQGEEDRRRQERHEATLDQLERQRVLEEASAAEQGIALPGVREERPAGPRAMVGDEELDLLGGVGPGLEPSRSRSEAPLLEGERGFFEGQRPGQESRPELGSRPDQRRLDDTGLEQAFSEELQAAASAPPGAEPDVEPGALDPETGQFTTEPIFRQPAGLDQGPSVGEFLREGRVERRGPEFRLSTGQRFEPGAQERQALQEEIDAIMAARPDLSRPEARLLAQGRTDALTFGREEREGLDRTFNVHGREFEELEEAVAAHRAFEGAGRGDRTDTGRTLTQTERTAREFGFDNVAEFRRFEDRMGDLEEVYGNTQGDPLLQRALEARARGLSEREVLDKIRSDARRAGWTDEELEQVEQDVRRFFGQRARRQMGALESGNLGDLPDFGSGFDLEFGTADTARARGQRGRRGARGAVRDRQ